jgi:hypothetical protein
MVAVVPALLSSLAVLSLVGLAVLWGIGHLRRRSAAVRQRIVVDRTPVRFRRQQNPASRSVLLPSSLPERSPPTFPSQRADDERDRDLS